MWEKLIFSESATELALQQTQSIVSTYFLNTAYKNLSPPQDNLQKRRMWVAEPPSGQEKRTLQIYHDTLGPDADVSPFAKTHWVVL